MVRQKRIKTVYYRFFVSMRNMAFMWIFYRSDNAISNDYLYHNIGDSVALYTQDGKVLKQDEVLSYPCVGEDHPGLRYFRSVRTTGRNESTVVALFSAKLLNTGTSYMKMWMPASSDVSYFTALAPSAKTASSPYQSKPSLLLRCGKRNLLWKNRLLLFMNPYRISYPLV